MNDTARHTIPRRLDDPERWLFWTVDEAAALMGPALLGLAASRPLVACFWNMSISPSWKVTTRCHSVLSTFSPDWLSTVSKYRRFRRRG